MSGDQGSMFPEIHDVAPEPAETQKGKSATVKLTKRRAALMRAGYHPLANVIPRLRLHPQAAPADDRAAEGLRCRGCARVTENTFNRTYLKCDLHPSRSEASDIRLWWPACTSYQPKEET